MRSRQIKLNYKQKQYLERVLNDKYGIKRKKQKAKVILLKSEGKSVEEIHKITGLCKRTIIYYVKQYLDNEKMFIQRYRYKQSCLKDIDGLINFFKENTPNSYREASITIRSKFNIKMSESATRAYLNKHKIYTKRAEKNKWKLQK